MKKKASGRRRRRTHTAVFKARVALAALRESVLWQSWPGKTGQGRRVGIQADHRPEHLGRGCQTWLGPQRLDPRTVELRAPPSPASRQGCGQGGDRCLSPYAVGPNCDISEVPRCAHHRNPPRAHLASPITSTHGRCAWPRVGQPGRDLARRVRLCVARRRGHVSISKP